MRLAEHVQEALVQAIDAKLTPKPGTHLYLFGSRTDDQKKGGDIDLLLVVPTESERRRFKEDMISLKANLREAAGDQRVDLVIVTPEMLATDNFLSTLEKKVSLKKW